MKRLLKRLKGIWNGNLDRDNGIVNGCLCGFCYHNTVGKFLLSEQARKTVESFRDEGNEVRKTITNPKRGNKGYIQETSKPVRTNKIRDMEFITRLRELHPKVAHHTASKIEEDEYFELLNSQGDIPELTYEKYYSNDKESIREALNFAIIIAGIIILGIIVNDMIKNK